MCAVELVRLVREQRDEPDQLLVDGQRQAHVRKGAGGLGLAHARRVGLHVRLALAQQHFVAQIDRALLGRARGQIRPAHIQKRAGYPQVERVRQIGVLGVGEQHGDVVGVHSDARDAVQVAQDIALVRRAADREGRLDQPFQVAQAFVELIGDVLGRRVGARAGRSQAARGLCRQILEGGGQLLLRRGDRQHAVDVRVGGVGALALGGHQGQHAGVRRVIADLAEQGGEIGLEPSEVEDDAGRELPLERAQQGLRTGDVVDLSQGPGCLE